MFSLPIIVLFWQDNGLNLFQIMVLQSLFALAVVLLEIPTGYFADIFGRKKSLIISSILYLLAIVFYSLGSNFFQFLIAEIFFSFSMSFMSGADSAFIYDTLKGLGREHLFKKIWGNILFYSLIAMSFASIVGGFIGGIDLRMTFYATIPFFLIATFFTFSLVEPERRKTIIKQEYLKQIFQIIKFSLIDNKRLKWLMIYSAIVISFNQTSLWLYQPYFKLSGLDIFYFGFIFAGFNIVAALTSKYAHIFEEKLGEKYSLAMLFVLTSISYLLMSNFVFLFSFSFAFLQQFVRGFSNVVIVDYINKLAPSEIRATVMSVEGMLSKLCYALIIPFIGWFADVYTLPQAFFILGITVFVLGGISMLFIHRLKLA